MSKFKSSILVISMVIIGIATALLTVLGLYFAGVLKTDPIQLVYTVQSVTKVYDGMPLTASDYELQSGELLEGHKATVTLTGEQTDVGTGKSGLKVTISDKKGFDVTKEYAVKVEEGQLIVTPEEVYIRLNDAQVVYNGKKVVFDDYEVMQGKLASGHRIEGSIPDAGVINVGDRLPENLIPVIYNAAGKNVTSNYKAYFLMGSIEVVPRPITIKPVDVKKVYDGTELVAEDYKIVSGSLAEDQWAQVTINGGNNSMTDADTRTTVITDVRIFMNGNDVTKNYQLDLSETGTMTVEPRELVVKAKSASWLYDGKEHSLQNDVEPESVTGLAPGETLRQVRYTEESKITDAGTEVNEIGDVDLSSDRDNYNIRLLPGTLEVRKVVATVYMKTFAKEYDGKTVADSLKPGELMYTVAPALPEGFEIHGEDGNITEVKDAGNRAYTLTNVTVSKEGGPDCSGNFDLTIIPGRVDISRRSVTVKTPSKTEIYNGEKLTGDNPAIENGIDGHVVEPKEINTPEIKNAGSVLNKYACVIKDGETDVTKNYSITYEYGTLTVTPKEVAITLDATASRLYDGHAYALTAGEVAGAIPEGFTDADFTVIPDSEIKNAGEYPYTVLFADQETAQNYTLTGNTGTYTVEKISAKVDYGDIIKEIYSGKPVEPKMEKFQLRYTGTPVPDDKNPLLGFSLYSVEHNDIIKVKVRDPDNPDPYDPPRKDTDPIDPFAGFEKQWITCSNYRMRLDETGEDVTANFNFDEDLIQILVVIKPLTVLVGMKDLVYAGSVLPSEMEIDDALLNSAVTGVTTLVPGDSIDWVSVAYERTDDYSGTLVCGGIGVINSKGEDVSHCYELSAPPSSTITVYTGETTP